MRMKYIRWRDVVAGFGFVIAVPGLMVLLLAAMLLSPSIVIALIVCGDGES